MKSTICQWLTDLQVLASKENLIVEAQHFDCLEFLFKSHPQDLDAALKEYKDFRKRYEALGGHVPQTPGKEVQLFSAFDVLKIFKEDKLPEEWIPKTQYHIKGATGNRYYFLRSDLAKVFLSKYLNETVASKCEVITANIHDLIFAAEKLQQPHERPCPNQQSNEKGN